jgi:hypothetical protein
VNAIDSADPKHVSAHYGQRNPLCADKIDADENNGSHG